LNTLIGIALFLLPCLPLLLYPRYWLAIWLVLGLFLLRMSGAFFDPDIDKAALLRQSATAGMYNLALLFGVVFARRLFWKLARNPPKPKTARGRWDWRRSASE
jgi:hypothetical protein